MSNPFPIGIGAVISADIAVPEHERELRFYSRVLGTGANPSWRDDLMNDLGMPIIGLGKRDAQYETLPLQWMPHIQVADVGVSAARAIELGGKELMHAQDGDGGSQWAVLQDPDGAAFGIVPVVPAEALAAGNASASRGALERTGRIAWLDLTVPDAVAAARFYAEVVGWTVQKLEMKDGGERYADHLMVGADGAPLAGVCHARGTNVGHPPVWMIYLPVGDMDESLRRVAEEGGAVIKASRGKDGAYAYAAVRDPVGVCVALVPGHVTSAD